MRMRTVMHAVGSTGDDRPPVRWKRALLAPGRIELRATAGQAGVASARVLYSPRRRRALGAVAQRLTAFGVRRGLGRSSQPPLPDIADLAALLGGRFDGAASIRSWRAGRLVCAFSYDARVTTVVKVGRPDDTGLTREIGVLRQLEGAARDFLVPRITWQGLWRNRLVLATEVLERRPRDRELTLDEVVALCLSLGGSRYDTHGFLVHGDLAPWNIVPTAEGVGLIDWELSSAEVKPLHDLAHYVTSKGVLTHSFGPEEALALLADVGSPGWCYLEALDLDPLSAPQLVTAYLHGAGSGSSPAQRRYRNAMLRAINERQGGLR